MAKYYLTLGYPLMVAASNVVEGYCVELSDNEVQVLPNDIALLWANLLSCDSSDNKPAIEKLAGRGLLIAGQTKEEILKQCGKFCPIRQGIGLTFTEKKDNENDVQYFSIKLGNENYTISDFQRFFWNKSNGKNAMSNILMDIRNEYKTILSDEQIANQIFALIKYGLLFIKKNT